MSRKPLRFQTPDDWLAYIVHLRRVRLRACLRALGVQP